ncbi:unnamed protein product, partial [Meganyctiphanes norvegica]
VREFAAGDGDDHVVLVTSDGVRIEGPRSKLNLHPVISPYVKTSSEILSVGEVSGVHTQSGGVTVNWPDPPPHDQVARVARYIMHISDWGVVATAATHSSIAGAPLANIYSVSDGPIGLPSGTPYFYASPWDISAKDWEADPRVSFAMSEAQSDYCKKHDYDPESPVCARLILNGNIVKLENGTLENKFAHDSLFSRHPEMKEWPQGHHFYFAKLNITHIFLLDFYGGATEIPSIDYYKAQPFDQNKNVK